jgi:hypothetical protein
VHARRQLHSALAFLVALVLHVAVWMGSSWMPRPARPPTLPVDADSDIELSFTDDGAQASWAGPETATAARVVSPTTSARARRPRPYDTASEARSAPSSPFEPGAAGAAEGEGRSKPPGAIDLGLNGGVRRAALLGGWVDHPSPLQRPSDGGLRQGLLALDAERGLSRSAAAHPAAYEAARRFAPANGMATFEVIADERGIVLSVTLASAPGDEAQWQRVGQELHQRLKDRRLRVIPGAKGLAARLRIETGELARDGAERFRTPRGAALGQAPLHPREVRAESTRDSLEPGHLSPTLGVALAGGSGSQRVRVVLLDEREL